jgi:DNA repair protein RadC
LNRANTTIGYAKISQGGLTGTVVDPRLVAKYAVESLAVGIILAHNHPSGNLKPSPQDIDLTKKIKLGLHFLDIEVKDHLILTSTGHYSLLENGLM